MKIIEFNATTREQIERDLNAEELAQLEADTAEQEAKEAEAAALAAAKQAAQDKLKALGLTDLEIAAITGGN